MRKFILFLLVIVLVAAAGVCFIPRVRQVMQLFYYDAEEVFMLIYPGSRVDRAIASGVIDNAEIVFSDITHTPQENIELYGPLGRYAVSSTLGAVSETHDLQLWSAYIDEDDGYIWVNYSHEAFDANGNIVYGSLDIPSLWHIEINDDGIWIVTYIKEHP